MFSKIKRLFSSSQEDKDRLKALEVRKDSPEYHDLIASAELENPRDLSHGLTHVAELLAFSPAEPKSLALLERYLERAREAGRWEAHLPETDAPYFATEALRALLQARDGRLEDAVRLLLAVVQAKPEPEYLETWALDWLEPEGALESLSAETARVLSALALNRFKEANELTVRKKAYASRFADLALRCASHHGPDEMVEMSATGLLRKSGRLDEALEHARDAATRRSSWHSSVAEGLVLRVMNRVDEAETAFNQAIRFDAADKSARLECGDMFLNRELWSQARPYYDQVLALDAQEKWALPSRLWCEWMESGAESPPSGFVDLVQAGNARAKGLYGQNTPYRGYLPRPTDATANVLQQVLERHRTGEITSLEGNIRLTLSDVEGPSNQVAFQLAMRALGADCRLEITVQNVASPDPREPIEAVAFPLWRREGETLVPALAEPPRDVQERIAAIAREPFSSQENWARASQVAQELGSGRLEEVLACLLHPALPPDSVHVLDWVPRIQLHAAQVLAHIDDGWERSLRKKALDSILLGPRDWSTEAAIIALAQLATEEPILCSDIHASFTKLREARPDSGHVGYESALYWWWLSLPHLFPTEREELLQAWRNLDEST